MNKGLALTVGRALLISAVALLLTGFARQEKLPITSLDRLAQPGISIAVGLDTPAESSLKEDYPEAKLVPYSDIFLAYQDVALGRIDACVSARREMEFAIQHGFSGVRLLDEDYASNKIAVGISPVTAIPDLREKLNAFIAQSKSDGTLDDMYERWVILGDETMPEIPPATDPTLTLRVGTTGTVMPYSFYVGTDLAGYDIELAQRFAAWLGAKLEFKMYDFGGIIAAAEAGRIDCIMSNLYYTDEKDESIPFSDVLFEVKITAMVRDDTPETARPVAGVRWQDYNGKRLGVLIGTVSGQQAQAALPDIELVYFNSQTTILEALRSGKVDAWCGDEPVLRFLMRENTDLTIPEGYLNETPYASVFPMTDAGRALCDQYSAFVEEMWADGTMDAIEGTWFGADEERRTVLDYEALPDTNGTLRMAVDTSIIPFAYVKDDRIVGYDVDIAARFCEAGGYRLEVVPMTFDRILSSVQSGECDFSGCAITVIGERAESVLFSTPTYRVGTVLAILKGKENAADAAPAAAEFTQFSQLAGRQVSMLTGAPFEKLVREKAPDVGEFSYFNNMPDILLALSSGKTDAVLCNNAVSQLAVNRNPELALFPQSLQEGKFGFAFRKGDPRCGEWQEAFNRLPEEAIRTAWEKWTGSDEGAKVLPKQDWPGANGTLTVAACDTLEPMSYAGEGGEIIGFDIELLLMTARELDVRLEFDGMEFSAVLSQVQSGKADIGAGSIIITEERAQSVDFVEYYPAAFVLIVRTAGAAQAGSSAAAAASDSALDALFSGLRASFNKTFVRESRWKLFLEGVLTTLLITLLSVLAGTALGFGVFMLCRNGNGLANGATRFSMWLVQGMPMVVLLMLLYYVIFGRVAINGIAVAVIGFALTFGAAVFSLLKMGVGAVDGGQYEAAYALGYSNRRTFFRIILPQALPHVLPAYRGEIVGLMKATSIVGYIAVQDLTKMGDIVRSRTYEAFFPLIAITIIYFVLEWLLGCAVSRVSLNFNPRRRKPDGILKGLKTDDQNRASEEGITRRHAAE